MVSYFIAFSVYRSVADHICNRTDIHLHADPEKRILIRNGCHVGDRAIILESTFKPFQNDWIHLLTILVFLVGCYVQLVSTRWWDQIQRLPRTEDICLHLATYMTGKNPTEELQFKKKFLRYLHHGWVLALTRVSPKLYSEFKTKGQYLDKNLTSE